MVKKRRKKRSGKGGKGLFPVSRKVVLDVLRSAGRPSYMREIVRMSGVSPDKKKDLRKLVREMVHHGDIIQFHDKRYVSAAERDMVTGIMSIHPDGFGFVMPEGRGDEVFIPPGRTGGAMHGDLVRAIVEKVRKKGAEGAVISVVRRNTRRIAGIFRQEPVASVVVPDDERLLFHVTIPEGMENGAADGDAVLVDIINMPDGGNAPEGRIIRVLGDPGLPDVQVKLVIAKYNLSDEFSREAMDEAGSLEEEIAESDLRGRKDLRELPLVTVDGADARDFDDAVHVRRRGNGYVLTVAIADVSHYVMRDSAIDRDAVERGTSVYFPSSVLPMLPEALSNNLCSLMPDVDRLAMVAGITFDSGGRVVRSSFFKAVIRSARRFTYSEVNSIFDGSMTLNGSRDEKLMPMLESMRELARLLARQRIRRGSIDFNLPEVAVSLEESGEIREIVKRQRGEANRMIEEFMLAANEAVARFLVERNAPAMFRIHEEPDRQKVEDFVRTASTLGLNLEVPEEITPAWFQHVLDMAAGTPREHIINTALLRTMQQAVYSHKNEGHFGLASPAYLHFTSPIRRYPDLVVHRILKGNFRKGRKKPVYPTEELATLALHLSSCERKAMEAEREMLDRLKAAYMAERIGEEFPAIISSVVSSGFFVELSDMFISGLVRVEELKDDHYILDRKGNMLAGKRSGRKYVVGDEIVVRVMSVSIERRKIDFQVVS